MESMNCSTAIWEDDAKAFRPSRRIEDAHAQNGMPAEAKEIRAHRHLPTFVDGSRAYLGENRGLKGVYGWLYVVVLTVLVKNVVFGLRWGCRLLWACNYTLAES